MAPQPFAGQIPVWDRFVRLFHWGVVALVATAFLSEDAKSLHIAAGYGVLALVAVRLVWGFVGTRHARFADFVTRPRTILAYLRDLRGGHARRYLGHNPAGGAMVVLLLALLLGTAGTGWLSETDRFFGNEVVSGIHAALANLLMVAIGLHVAGVLVSSLLHGENLVRAMITGRKPASVARQPEHEDRTAAGPRLHPR